MIREATARVGSTTPHRMTFCLGYILSALAYLARIFRFDPRMSCGLETQHTAHDFRDL